MTIHAPRFTSFLALFVGMWICNAALAADNPDNGKTLYDKSCNGMCHDTRIHTRPNRIIHTYSDLVNRVKFCDAQAKAGFDKQQISDVSDYLNHDFYKFVKE